MWKVSIIRAGMIWVTHLICARPQGHSWDGFTEGARRTPRIGSAVVRGQVYIAQTSNTQGYHHLNKISSNHATC